MADKYNPHAPAIIGNEWVPIVNRDLQLSTTAEYGHSFHMSSPDATVTHGRFYVKDVPSFSLGSQVATMNVYEKGNECNTGPIQTLRIPVSNALGSTSDATKIFADCNPTNATSDASNACTNTVVNPSDAQTVSFSSTDPTLEDLVTLRVISNYNTSDVFSAISGQRIMDVSILAQIGGSLSELSGLGLACFIEDGLGNQIELVATNIQAPSSSGPTGAPIQRFSLGEVTTAWNSDFSGVESNKIALPWSATVLNRFGNESSAGLHIVFTCAAPMNMTQLPSFGFFAMEISFAEENRLATGGVVVISTDVTNIESIPGYNRGTNEVPLFNPLTYEPGVLLEQGNDYTVTVNLSSYTELMGGGLATLESAQQLYPMPSLPGIIITRDTVSQTQPVCEVTDILPQLSLWTNDVLSTDNFNRTETACWGTQSDGDDTYICTGLGGTVAQTDFTVNGTNGVHSVPTTSAFRQSYVTTNGAEWMDHEIYLEFSSPINDVTGGVIEIGNILAYVPTGDRGVLFRTFVDTGNDVRLSIEITNFDGTLNDNVIVGPVLAVNGNNAWQADDTWAVRIRSYDGVFEMRVWNVIDDVEPPWWTIIGTQSNFNTNPLDLGSQFAIRSGVRPGNTNTKPCIFEYDNLEVRIPMPVLDVHGYGSLVPLPVWYWQSSLTTIVDQDIIDAAAADGTPYQYIRFYARVQSADAAPLEFIDVGITPIASITAAELLELPDIVDGWREVTLALDTPVIFDTAGPNDNNFGWRSVNTDAGQQWQILGATARTTYASSWRKPYVTPDNPTYGSADYDVTWVQHRQSGGGRIADIRSDAVLMFSNGGPAVSGLSVTQETLELAGIGLECGLPPRCMPTGLTYNFVSWDAISSAPVSGISAENFGHYELQRSDDDDPTWHTIMTSTCMTTTSFNDYESRIDVNTSYRIRSCDVLGFCGPWSDVVTTMIPAPGVIIDSDHARVLIFTSNVRQDGSATLAYSPVWEQAVSEDFVFPEAATQTLQRMYGKNYFTAFRPLERGGVQFMRTLLVQAAAVPTPILQHVVEPLRDLAWADLPYVCVRTEEGDMWLANVLVPTASVRRQRSLQLAQVQISEVSDTPYAVETDCVEVLWL